MLALFLVLSASPDSIFVPPAPPTPAPIERSVPQSRADWMGESAREPTNPADLTVPHVEKVDTSAPLLTGSNMCIVVQGQPLPDCAKATNTNSGEQLVLSDDIFTNSVAGDEATCQTIETVRTDANGKPQRVFASYCGEDIRRNDYREVNLPTGSSASKRPTDRNFGPTNISAVP